MKNLKDILENKFSKNQILEKLVFNKHTKVKKNYHPKTKAELIKCFEDKLEKYGLGTKDNQLNLNDIDVSQITDMSQLFDNYRTSNNGERLNLYIDISEWDVSNVENMEFMFRLTKFNGDISNWDVSNVEDMSFMFDNTEFNSNISNWNVSNVKNM